MALLYIDIYGKEPWNISFAIFFPGPPQKHLEKDELRLRRNVYECIAPTGRAHKTHKNILKRMSCGAAAT